MDEAENLLETYAQWVMSRKRCPERDQARAAVLAAMRKGGVPEGWQLVPKVPTEEMEEAGWIDKEDVCPCDIYTAMLAAAPQPPALPLDRDGIIEACVSAIAELRNGKDADSTACYFLNNAIDAIRAMKVRK
jgi:hypothetical protein